MPNGLLTADYDFVLPPDRIAQRPTGRRDASRLLVVHRETGLIEHRQFSDLSELIPPGDVLVVNRTRVRRARLLGTRASSGAPAEILLLRPSGDGLFEAMVSPGGKLKPGRRVDFAPGFFAEIISLTARGTRIVRLVADQPVDDAIEQYGHIPLPPYIGRPDDALDTARYQTIYGDTPGSIAAPTAGLHFTTELMETLERRGVRRADVVLHVGAGTFKPVDAEDPAHHEIHEEWCALSVESAGAINDARSQGRHTWAVGTTTVRTLESIVDQDGRMRAHSGDTRLFIRPPYPFGAVDRIITNFHLPRSTLIMLVAAFAGYELTMQAYREAIEHGYRFYSYGDAMVVL